MADSMSKTDAERPNVEGSLEIHLLGPFRVVVDGRAVAEREFTRRKPKQLIKLLALQPHHQLHREQAMEFLWPDSDPESATNNLHKAVHLARHSLEPALKSAADSHFIITRGQQIVLSAPGMLYIDAEEFERQATAAIKSDDAASCETALGLYRGDLLNEDAYEDWAATRREQLRELYHRLLARLPKIYEAQGDYQQSIEALGKLIAADTSNEEAHRDLMRLYALTGNRHQALRQFQQCVESLRRELDAGPEPATVELHRQIESGLFRTHAAIDTPGAIESIAIAPLLNASGDPEMEYLSDGLTENIIHKLSQLPGLRVMAWGTVARFKGTETTAAEIGRTLGVRVVLTGRMLQVSERLIVRVELIDAVDGAHLWGDHYDRNLADIFAMQDDIASEISENLRLKLTGEQKKRLSKRHTESTIAYQHYLKGRYFWYKRTEHDLKKGIEYFNRAIEEDPSYAAAYDGLSLAHIRLHEWDWTGLDEEFKHALKLNPGHSIAYHWYSEYLTAMGRADESIVIIEKAKEIDPLSPISYVGLAGSLYFARRYDEAINHIQDGFQIGRYEEGIAEMQKAVSLSGRSTEALAGLARAYAVAGSSIEAGKILDELTAQSATHYVSPYSIAKVFAALGQKEQAFAWLEKAYNERNPDFIELKAEPALEDLHDDSRFADLLRRVGLE